MRDFFLGFFYLNTYYLICGAAAISLRIKTKIDDEIFRKLLHCVLLGSMAIWVAVIPKWWQAALTALFYAIMGYPALNQSEQIKDYPNFLTERNPGELKSSMLLAYLMFAVVIAVCWGIFDDKYLVIASVYAWGVGDAFAALVGTRYGKHKIKGKFLTGKKSWEGTAVMFLGSFVSVAIILLYRGGLTLGGYIIIPLIVAAISTAAELYSRNGYDTVICPLCAMVALLPLTYLFGGMS